MGPRILRPACRFCDMVNGGANPLRTALCVMHVCTRNTQRGTSWRSVHMTRGPSEARARDLAARVNYFPLLCLNNSSKWASCTQQLEVRNGAVPTRVCVQGMAHSSPGLAPKMPGHGAVAIRHLYPCISHAVSRKGDMGASLKGRMT